MRYEELRSVMERVSEEDRNSPESYKPVVAIGHSKDLVDFDSIRRLLEYLAVKHIGISTFEGVTQRLQSRMSEPTVHISICVCTFKRPALLAELLDGLVNQSTR